ncbi:CLUMA_CG020881, isoform A [Clunio marinus]|uniref:Tyrosine-protein phosphatase non-receptor type 9 n=1 Tax=Clunio marinus TaxID=568069 RepID=A0A1J1J6V7_9DIPT|nr:CLUMA_CG020881, isoform A [Clunio marinus]
MSLKTRFALKFLKNIPYKRKDWQCSAYAARFFSEETRDDALKKKTTMVSKADIQKSPQLLSKLFPQTAVTDQSDTQMHKKKEEEEEKKDQDKQWKRMKLGFYIFGVSAAGFSLFSIYELGQPQKDHEGNIIEDQFSHLSTFEQYKRRILASFNYYQKFVQEPSYQKLLPDPLKHPYVQPKYTLVLEMKDVLVHPDWTYQTGWRFKKRPGVDHFLEQLGRIFEIVVYTADHGMTVFPVLDALDPNGFIMYRLVRDATHFVDGHHVKSLDKLNRDLSKVIVIDWNAHSTKFHPENSFNIPRWNGNDDDTTLFDLTSFLKTIVTADVDDVREVMLYYKQFSDPIEKFKSNQQAMTPTDKTYESKVVDQFIQLINSSIAHQSHQVEKETAILYLSARKFDLQKAILLYEANISTREREGLFGINTNADPLRSELATGKFTVLSSRDVSGAAISIFTARLHYPHQVTHKTTLQGIVYQLDAALKSPNTQRNGLVFIYDMSGSKYSNFDYDLSQKILNMLKGCYPAKLKKVLIVTAPLWFKAPFKILRLFVREKLRDRVFIVSVPQLNLHFPKESLPINLGGTLEVEHFKWLKYCDHLMTIQNQDDLFQSMSVKLQPYDENSILKVNDFVYEIKTDSSMEKQSCSLSRNNTNFRKSDCDENNGVISQQHWPEHPSSSASPSSGFSDDDSLAGTNDVNYGKTIQQFAEMVKKMEKKGLIKEYAEIRSNQPDGSFENARNQNNLTKNRYTDVLCYDHSRVILSVDENDDEKTSATDYINANFVDGYKQKNAYISTQGPLPKTAQDFWRMAWEQKCLVIVMTTKTMERGRLKCHQYWEEKVDQSITYGIFSIKTIKSESNLNYTISSLEIKNLKTEEIRKISHWQFTSWPDYGVPSSALAVLTFLQGVREKQAEMLEEFGEKWEGHQRGPPIIVHCSAGIGRTGTFITLDICISRLEDVGTVDVRGTVEKIRGQRAFSIQMPDQYVFCHLALIEYAWSHNHLSLKITLDDFNNTENSDSD